jgi:response regulator RpfG family c-di-GMP phosphodiesterase
MNDIMFAEETVEEASGAPWKVLIVDDEESVHTITKSVLKNQEIDGKGIEFYSAFSGAEAIEVLSNVEEIAVIFLDVVMESNEAGLEACRKIREELKNDMVRIILRTGQPGSAPENEVIIKYRINDYKEKTDLTASKLFSCMVTAIRSYQDLLNLEQSKQGLKKVIEATKTITKKKSIGMFLEGILDQLVFILDASESSVTSERSSCYTIACDANGSYQIMSSMGNRPSGKLSFENLPVDIQSIITDSHREEANIIRENLYAGHFHFGEDQGYIFCLAGSHELQEIDKNLLNIFSGNINVALENLFLNEEIINTQTELIEKLGEVVEKRSTEASQHVNRVSKFSYLLALDYGLPEINARLLSSASPMHDIGKVGIPDAILLKPGKLTEEEFEVMKTHAQIGHNIFSTSKRSLLQAASVIALDHHEKWDGSGYPNGKKGDDIHIYGRITAVADVFDALYHNRCYKPAWPIDNIVSLFKEQRGIHFDPALVDIILSNLEKYKEIVEEG